MHNWIGSKRAWAAVSMLAAVTVAASADDGQRQVKKHKGLWPLGGRDIRNTRHQRAEDTINVDNAAFLQVRWAADTDGDISATPAVDESSVYVPDWAGKLYAFNRHTGVTRWSDAAKGTVLWRFPSGDFCAAGAAVSRGMVFWGTGYTQLGVPDLDGGGKLYAFGLP